MFSTPLILAEYFSRRTGEEYRLGLSTKIALFLKMRRNNHRIIGATDFLEHIVMATKILTIPKSVEGCIVECGCYKGKSTANLSLVCSLCKRTLEVFDSFEGLPEPSNEDKAHVVLGEHKVHTYSKGDYHANLSETKENVSRYGNINVCNFNVGYFEDTLPKFKKKSVFIFLDVDLVASVKTCLRHLWSLLQDNSYLFTHEAHHMEIASLFFDKDWWRNNMDGDPPGLVGAGNGLGIFPESGGFRSYIGYTVKNPKVSSFRIVS